VTQIVLINGAPGSGKSTAAQQLAQDIRLALALNIDVIKHSLGQCETDATGAGQQARRPALAMADEHVGAGNDVIIGQYLARFGLERTATPPVCCPTGCPTLIDA
jgi:hypothetical protein